MFKWQKKIFSLLVVMFIFSFGFNCSAVEDYLIYIGGKETNCSKCKASLASKDCISNFPAVLSLVSAKDEKGGLKLGGEYIGKNYCFIPFERNVSENIDVEKIYKNTKNHFCGKCMLEYFVDKFHETNSANFNDWKKKYTDNVLIYGNLRIEITYDEFVKKFVKESTDFPFPIEFVSSRKINSYRCKYCVKLFFTSFQSLISQEGYRICPDCERKIEKKYEDYKKDGVLSEFLDDYHSSRLRIPCITGRSILNRYEEKYNLKKAVKKAVKKDYIKDIKDIKDI